MVGKRFFRSQVTDLAWTPDGYSLLAASSDGRCWGNAAGGSLGGSQRRAECWVLWHQLTHHVVRLKRSAVISACHPSHRALQAQWHASSLQPRSWGGPTLKRSWTKCSSTCMAALARLLAAASACLQRVQSSCTWRQRLQGQGHPRQPEQRRRLPVQASRRQLRRRAQRRSSRQLPRCPKQWRSSRRRWSGRCSRQPSRTWMR